MAVKATGYGAGAGSASPSRQVPQSSRQSLTIGLSVGSDERFSARYAEAARSTTVPASRS